MNRNPGLVARLKVVRLFAMDIDGVLTDGGVVFIGEELEAKRFHIHDGLGIQLAMLAGIRIAWISGRSSSVVRRRAAELGVTELVEGCANKSAALAALMERYGLEVAQVAYMGDDLNDLPAFESAGFRFAPANAVEEIRNTADIVTGRAGGSGAVREACELLLKAQDAYAPALERFIERLGVTPVRV